ncbi:PAS domain S-box protein [Bradyrhizobium sp. KBS0727]|uniref:PAS domain S-box protein n=1 Tax=unclassified Bradyrhizobium TaxID=2631580 RepID=UPI00110D6808|nr:MULTISPECIES: PAS domain S-box protein [unclassified Bradyrhizobium]QDW36149.1 PAS domain S-box protein [Bradyrhizobium sp. KBS0725]QDW42750.1 PAS domain S-box protein [Bradyrhizobium sp. KBS0727]
MTLTTRLAIAMIALVAIAVSAVGWLSYRSLEQAVLPRVLDRIETHSRLAANELESQVRTARGDIATFHGLAAVAGLMRARLNGGIDPTDGTTEALWRERLAGRLAAQMPLRPAYSLRFIGVADGHREIVRVDRSGPNDAVRVVPDAELKQVGDAAYFRDTIKLAPNEIYVSPVDLNEENGVIANPHVPTMRIAMPIFAPGGKPFGIVIATADMRPALARVRASVRPGERVYVVDARGNYLVHPDRAREFGSQLGTPTDWRKDFPDLAASIGATKGVAQIVQTEAGRPGGEALAPALLAGSEWTAVIESVPNAVVMAPAQAIQNSSITVGLIAVLCATLLALLIARSLTRPIVQLTKAVEAAARSGTAVIPVDARGETGVLARAFAHVMGEANAKTIALEREVGEHRRTIAARDHHAERERLFSAAVESSNDAIITMSLDGTITGWNSAAGRLFGYSAAEATGQGIALLVPDDRLSEVQDSLRRIGWGESIEQNETVRLRKDGTPIEVSLSISPIKAPSGATIGISKVARDITDSNKTRQVLRQQTEELRRIFETSQDLILVMDARGFLVQISPSCEAILGFRPEEMIGRSGSDFIHPDHLENSREELRAARRGLRSKISDTRCMHKDGRAVWLSWLGTWSEPVKRFFLVGRDMTESRLAQETLRESEQLARGIINSALDAFVQTDERGIIRDWNSQAEVIFGWPRTDMLGKNVFKMIAPDPNQSPVQAGLGHFLESGLEQVARPRREVQARRRDGTEFTAELSITALKTRDGFVFNCFMRDLTDKIAAEDRIRQAEKMEAVGQLTGGIAHDFNNILTVITGTIEILADAVKGEPQLAAITRMIDEAASRGADLTQHLLAFARKQPLEPRETDVNTLIIDTAKLLQRTLGEHVEIESVFEDEVCPALVDPNQLATAILNLALNARDAMPNGGKLIIETGGVVLDENYARTHGDVRPGRYAMIAVSDTGTGIRADLLDKVFNPFFTSKGPGKGTGLGLSMVYGFVKQSAGHIMIYSEEGHGTTIKMYLPPATGTLPAAEPTLAPVMEGGHETILVVEDDKLVRDYVLTQLHSLGYVTLDAANATEALAIANAGRPFDLLFTDVIMPGINGRQLANEISRIKPGLKVLFTSGYTENAIIHHGRLDEGVLLLAKPYRKSDMAIMIRKALAD